MRWAALLTLVGCGRIGFDAPDPIDLVGVPFGPPRPITELNGTFDDDDSSLVGDLREIYFASGRGRGFFTSTRSSDTEIWGPVVAVPELDAAPCTTGLNNPGVSANGLVIVFACQTAGSNELWSSARTDRATPWASPQPIVELATSPNDGDPDPGVDGTRLYFYSDSRGPDASIWLARRETPQDTFAAPVPVGSLAGAQGPWIDATERIAYFFVMIDGSRDLFVATRATPEDAFGAPVPLVELNTPTLAEEDPWLSPDLRTIVFAAGPNSGSRDLYIATR